ncbi:helix-turn-helix transcriptional regulator [Streptomyces sp. RB6PN25]|uniref:Helix-turn-helix transcriptional regulator n=1 Tax=Streptomyces humicola TaxID=2953240 RepID=A0ABT1PW18_9ACTN|nr:helix-turn-helix transcriptional regulator [Streptomyces humicola]MCQ4081205.1 helix-turn-helix transcriptional regulator [Streptomyces humicola]
MTTTQKLCAPVAVAPEAAASRRCRRCGCRLSAYNADELCGACARAELPPADDTPRVPARVWADPEVREALAAWNFGQVSRLVRQRGSIRQEDVAQLTGLSQGFLSMLESGARRLTSIDRIVDFLDGLAVPADLVRVPRRRPVPRTAALAAIPAQADPRRAEGVPPQGRGSTEADAPWTAEQAIAALSEATTSVSSESRAGAGMPPARCSELSAYVQRWATAPSYRIARPQHTGAEVPSALLDQVQATTDLMRRMDDEHGGGSLAQPATAHLAVVVGLLRHGRYGTDTGRRLAAVAADAAGQAGWYQLDGGRPAAAAQRLMFAALRAAHAADDARIAAGVLVHLAISAHAVGRPRDMLDAVRAGQERTRDLDAPGLRSVLLAWEARGHARLGRRREALNALGLAADLCVRGRGEDEPQWLINLDEGDIHAQAGSCHLDLGDHRQAVASLTLAAERLRPAQVRTRGLVLARTATARLRLGDPQGAHEVGEKAMDLAARIRSARLDELIRGLTESLPGLRHRVD